MGKEEEKKVDREFELVQVPTEYQLAVKKKDEEKPISINDLLIEMANRLKELETYLMGK